jgi:hypothetical protein
LFYFSWKVKGLGEEKKEREDKDPRHETQEHLGQGSARVCAQIRISIWVRDTLKKKTKDEGVKEGVG